jgi:tetratricopeptide (TPR) repeat protein
VLTREEGQLMATLARLKNEGNTLAVLGLEDLGLGLACGVQEKDPKTAQWILDLFGMSHYTSSNYGRARELFERRRAMAEVQGDRAGVAMACGNLGNIYDMLGDHEHAINMQEQARAMFQELGDRSGVAGACGNLGCYYENLGEYKRALVLHEQHWTMAEALGDDVGMSTACTNLGNCYLHMGKYARAIELHEQKMTFAVGLGNRALVAGACGNIGNCYSCMGEYARAREMYEQAKAIHEALHDREGMAKAYGNIGVSLICNGEYARAVPNLLKLYYMGKELQLVRDQARAALYMGIALRLEVRVNVRGRAAGASDLPGPPASASACSDEGVRLAEKWLQTALDLGRTAARLQLAHLACDAGQEDTALAHLQDYLSWCVQRGRNRCAGCNQTRGEDAQMLTCGGCRVARFCNAEHQKMASKRMAEGRHRDVCHVLGKWRLQVVKNGMSPKVLRADLLTFLRQ